MAETYQAERQTVLSGRRGGSAQVRITPCEPVSRISLRAGAAEVPTLSAALGLTLPTRPKGSARSGDRFALWLGPDEWLVIDESGADLMAAAGGAGVVHSAVDVSHRNTGIIVSGPGAAVAINAGCPLDLTLRAFPVGAAARSVFGKIECVIYRLDEDTFRIECWRSFATYAFGLLAEGALDTTV